MIPSEVAQVFGLWPYSFMPAHTPQSVALRCRNMLSRPEQLLRPSERMRSVVAFSSKGFGAPKHKASKAGGGKSPARTAEQAADLAEAAASSPKVRPINPKEAARGKVDYVQVRNWADGSAASLGELQVVPDTYTAEAYTAGGSSKTSGPFYQQLAHHAQYLESQGALSLAVEPGAKPFLPFESWQYSLPRYRQYLAELAAVHEALEEALQLALSSSPAVQEAGQQTPQLSRSASSSIEEPDCVSSTSSGGSQPAPWKVPGRSAAALSAYDALGCFGPESGLWRAAAAAADLTGLLKLAALQLRDHDQHRQQQEQHVIQHKEHVKLHASQNAVAYGRYLLQLGRSAAAATTAAASATKSCSTHSRSAVLLAEEDEGYRAVLKLIAHAYAVHVQQQCLGTRIGAVATDHLGLLSAGVSALYLDYPDHVKEPVQQLAAVTDAAGRQLDAASKQVVFEELPKALQKATLLLAPLATA